MEWCSPPPSVSKLVDMEQYLKMGHSLASFISAVEDFRVYIDYTRLCTVPASGTSRDSGSSPGLNGLQGSARSHSAPFEMPIQLKPIYIGPPLTTRYVPMCLGDVTQLVISCYSVVCILR